MVSKETLEIKELYQCTLQLERADKSFGLSVLFHQNAALAAQAAMGVSEGVLTDGVKAVNFRIYFPTKEPTKEWKDMVATGKFAITIGAASEEFGVEYRDNKPDLEVTIPIEELDGKTTEQLDKYLREKLGVLIKEKRKELQKKQNKGGIFRFLNG